MVEAKANAWGVAFWEEPPGEEHTLLKLGCTFSDSIVGIGHCNFLHNSYNAMRGPPLLVFTITCNGLPSRGSEMFLESAAFFFLGWFWSMCIHCIDMQIVEGISAATMLFKLFCLACILWEY